MSANRIAADGSRIADDRSRSATDARQTADDAKRIDTDTSRSAADTKRVNVWRVETASPEHIPAIAAHMREQDRRELWVGNRQLPEAALRHSLAASSQAWTCFVHDAPACMGGVARQGCIFADVGVPWLLGTNAIYEVRHAFLRQSRAYVDRMQKDFARLENIVHAENTLSIRWLQWCGFVIEKHPVVINGERFFPFWREK